MGWRGRSSDKDTLTLAGVKSLPKKGIERLQEAGERRRFAIGQVLMRQGDPSEAMYFILSGRVRVTRGYSVLPEVELATLGPGEVVGEMGVLDGEPRSATVTAIEDTIVVEISALKLAEMVTTYPDIYGGLLQVLSKRLRSTDELAAGLVTRRGLVAGGGKR